MLHHHREEGVLKRRPTINHFVYFVFLIRKLPCFYILFSWVVGTNSNFKVLATAFRKWRQFCFKKKFVNSTYYNSAVFYTMFTINISYLWAHAPDFKLSTEWNTEHRRLCMVRGMITSFVARQRCNNALSTTVTTTNTQAGNSTLVADSWICFLLRLKRRSQQLCMLTVVW